MQRDSSYAVQVSAETLFKLSRMTYMKQISKGSEGFSL